MAVLFLCTSFIATLAIFYITEGGRRDIKTAYLKACLSHAMVIVVITEVLGRFEALNYRWLTLTWSVLAAGTLGYLVLISGRNRKTFSLPGSIRKAIDGLNSQPFLNRLTMISMAVIIIISLGAALINPPNNLDSLSYHMPRVAHWVQNQSVAHYPTYELRQISFSPGVGFLITHLQILTGGDHLANLIQWMAFLGCIIAVSLIARNTAGAGSSITAALMCASIPMAILQATTTQTDLTVSFWLACFVYFIFRTTEYSLQDYIWLSVSLGLAILSKPTAYIFGGPFLIVLSWRILHYPHRKNLLKRLLKSCAALVCILVISLSPSVPSYLRNYEIFNSFLGVDSGTRVLKIGPKTLISNLLRNTGQQVPFSPYWKFIEAVHRKILKQPVDDPQTTYRANSFSDINPGLFILPDEDFAGSPIHMISLIIAFLVLFYRTVLVREDKLSNLILLSLCAVAGFLSYCLLIKWQIWGSRLLLPLSILFSPLIGYFIRSRLQTGLQYLLCGIFIFVALFYSLSSARSPLIPLPDNIITGFRSESILGKNREDLYFTNTFENMRVPIFEMARLIQRDGCHAVGLNLKRTEFEYLIWVALNAQNADPVKIKHVGVRNESRSLPPEFPDSDLCAVVTVDINRIVYRKTNGN